MNRWGLPWPNNNNNSKRETESSRREDDDDNDDASFVSSGTTPMLLSKAEMNALPQLNHSNNSTNGIVVYDDSMSRSGIWIDENHPESSSSLVATPQQQKNQLRKLLVVDDDTGFLSIQRTTTTPSSTTSSFKKKEPMFLYDDNDTAATDGAGPRQFPPPPSEVTSPLSTVNSNTPKHNHPNNHSDSKPNQTQAPSFSSFFASNHHPAEGKDTQENQDLPSTFKDILSLDDDQNRPDDDNVLLQSTTSSSSSSPYLLQNLVTLSEQDADFITSSTSSNSVNEEEQRIQSILSANQSDWQQSAETCDFSDSAADKVTTCDSIESKSNSKDTDCYESQDRQSKPTLSMLDIENNISHESIGLLSTKSDTSQCSFNSVSSSRWIVENRRQQRLSKSNNSNNNNIHKKEMKAPIVAKPPFNFESAYLVWMSHGMLPETFRPNAKFYLVKKMDRELEQKLKHRRETIESTEPTTSHNPTSLAQSFFVKQQQHQQQPVEVVSSAKSTVVLAKQSKDSNKKDGKNFENILNRWKEVSNDKPCSHFLAFQQTCTMSLEEATNNNDHSSKIVKPTPSTTSRGSTPSRRLSSHVSTVRGPTTQEENKNPSMIAKLQSCTSENEMTRRLSLPNRALPGKTSNSNKIPESIEPTRNTKISVKSYAGSTDSKHDIIHSQPLPLRRDPAPVVAVDHHSTTTARTPHATLRVIGVSAAKALPSPRKTVEPVIDISNSTRNLKLQAATMFGRRREKKNAEDGGDEEEVDGLGQTSSTESSQRPDYKSVVHAYLRDVDSKTNKNDPSKSRSKSVPRSTTRPCDNLVADRETPCESENDHTKIPSKNYKRSQSAPRSNQKLDDFSILAIRNQIRKETACIQDALLRGSDAKTLLPPCEQPADPAFVPQTTGNPETTIIRSSKTIPIQNDDPVSSLNAAIRNQLGKEIPSFLEASFYPKNKHCSSPSEMVIRTQLRREVASLQQEFCGMVTVTPGNAHSSASFAGKDSLKERDFPAANVKDLAIPDFKDGKMDETPTNKSSEYKQHHALSPYSHKNKAAFDEPLPLEGKESTQHREDLFSPFTKQVMEKLKIVNDAEQIVSPPTTKTAFSQRPWQHDRLIRRVDSLTDESNSKLDAEPVVCRECNCSASVFSGNDDMVDFFLPLMGAACTCTNKPFGLINTEEPTSLVNILRPWQVEFLAGFGIYRGEELVKANHRSASALANALRQYRKRENLPPFPTQSCAM
jgi:hypothetical protein